VKSVINYITELKLKTKKLSENYKELKKKNSILLSDNKKSYNTIEKLKYEIESLKKKIDIANFAQGLDSNDSETSMIARKRINKLIREINNCISMLNE
tara:strand:- start:1227 stop:1520 length:294 start_codon:yes stop_codon:yes gene_type:complete